MRAWLLLVQLVRTDRRVGWWQCEGMHLTGYLTNKSRYWAEPKPASRSRQIEEPVLVCQAVNTNSIDLSIRQVEPNWTVLGSLQLANGDWSIRQCKS